MMKHFSIIAILLAIITIAAATTPDFARVAGAPLGIGIAAAGFAIGAGLRKE